jgi:hypothetical protein
MKRMVELVGYPDMSHMMDWPELGTPNWKNRFPSGILPLEMVNGVLPCEAN